MNWRFALALLLAIAVVLVTPRLFPGRPAPVGAPSAAPGVSPTVTQPADTTQAVGANVQRAAIPTTPAQHADTATITTAKARLRLSSVGGALIGAEMTGFRKLGAASGQVELARPGAPLLTFQIVAGGETLAVNRATFRASPSADGTSVSYSGDVGGVPVTVEWRFAADTYHVHIKGGVEPVGYVGRLTVRAAPRAGGAFLLVQLPSTFQSSERDTIGDLSRLAYVYKQNRGSVGLVRFGKPNPGERDIRRGPLDWTGAKSKYFLVGLLAPRESDAFAELQVVGVPKVGRVASLGNATAVVPMRNGVADLEVYVGPQESRRLAALGRDFDSANPYGGWLQGVVQPIATFVIWLLLRMHEVSGLNYGWVLIAFGVLIRVILWPLNQTVMRSSIRMQRIQPELQAIQKKYNGSPEKLQAEMMRVYREHGMSPFAPISGCLPMLIPMPVLFALFFVFQNTIEFRGVGFWWMADISQRDPLFILPILMGASMLLLSWLGTRNSPPNPQATMMMYTMPVVMTIAFVNFAAGLNLYYAAQNIASLPQQWLIANERAKASPRSG